MTERLKKCCTCKEPLPVSAFPRDGSKPDGLDICCRECRRRLRKANYTLNHRREKNTTGRRYNSIGSTTNDGQSGETCRERAERIVRDAEARLAAGDQNPLYWLRYHRSSGNSWEWFSGRDVDLKIVEEFMPLAIRPTVEEFGGQATEKARAA